MGCEVGRLLGKHVGSLEGYEDGCSEGADVG
jgi:hypothetical protein